jgi:DNA-binding CsgD family transcriptional regulator
MDNITLREKEVLRLLSLGYSTKEIANRLGISFHTVESHRKNLRFKFAAKNSTELIMKVMKFPDFLAHN